MGGRSRAGPLVAGARPPIPPGPYVVAGLRRAGQAAARALAAARPADSVRAWDADERQDTAAARSTLDAIGATVTLGGDGLELLKVRPKPRCLVKSPGVPLTSPLVAAALANGLAVIDEAELGWRLDKRPFFAVTGTSGKGTSAALLCAALAAAGLTPLLAGNTLFGPPLSEAAGAEADVIVAELSSFQLAGSPELLPEASLFTNLGHQHWDYHGGVEAYAAAKRRMFVRGERAARFAALNVDDREGRRLAADVERRGGHAARYGRSAGAEYRVVGCDWSIDRAGVLLETPSGSASLETCLPGEHNAMNLAGALALVETVGLGSADTRRALADTRPPPGRFEPVDEGQPFSVIVDFAHNPDAIAAVLRAGRGLVDAGAGGRLRALNAPLWVHDPDLRRAMVRSLRAHADEVVITTQRWRREEPLAPPPDVIEEATASGGCIASVVNARAAAIRELVSRAQPGDVVLILGRGSLQAPLYDDGDQPRPFDDAKVAAGAARRWAARAG